MKKILITIIATLSTSAMAAEPIGAILTNLKGTVRIYETCELENQLGMCDQTMINYETTDANNVATVVQKSTTADSLTVVTNNTQKIAKNVDAVTEWIGAAPVFLVTLPIAYVEFELNQGQLSDSEPFSKLLYHLGLYSGKVVSTVIGTPVGLTLGKISYNQAYKLFLKLGDRHLKGQVIETRLTDYFKLK